MELVSNQIRPGLSIQIAAILLMHIQRLQDRERLLTEEEARQILGVSYQTMYRWRQARLIEFVKLPGIGIRYTRESVQKFVAEHVKPVRTARATVRKVA
jgi:excisionase family DNA binding protein